MTVCLPNFQTISISQSQKVRILAPSLEQPGFDKSFTSWKICPMQQESEATKRMLNTGNMGIEFVVSSFHKEFF